MQRVSARLKNRAVKKANKEGQVKKSFLQKEKAWVGKQMAAFLERPSDPW